MLKKIVSSKLFNHQINVLALKTLKALSFNQPKQQNEKNRIREQLGEKEKIHPIIKDLYFKNPTILRLN